MKEKSDFMNSFKETNEYRKSALVVEGGAMRGIFSTGILDAFIENNFKPFDIYLGVSAGATNLASYLAEMHKRNYKVYTDYSIRPDFINFKKFIFGGHLVDLDWLWNITIKELRLDVDKIHNLDKDYLVGVTDTGSGSIVYLKPDRHNLEEILKASSALPIFYRGKVIIEGKQYVDGGLADPIPVMEAYKRGAKTIMVLRSRPYSYRMKPSSNSILNKLYLRKYPKVIEAINNRSKVYEESIAFLRKPHEGVKIIEVNPPEDFQTKRLTKDIQILEKDYKNGYKIGLESIAKWNSL